ncbi:MAG: amino acid racemase [Alphaproteobacteria bacterium]|nr:amino acid racemase [Alphaproteobacteria bacterium]
MRSLLETQILTPGIIGALSAKSTDEFMNLAGTYFSAKYSQNHNMGYRLAHLPENRVNEWLQTDLLSKDNQWRNTIIDTAKQLKDMGADFINLTPNLPHIYADEVEYKVGLPVLNAATVTAETAKKDDNKTVGLLATKKIMTWDFFKDKLKAWGVNVIVPSDEDIELMNKIILTELKLGKINSNSRDEFIRIVSRLMHAGAKGVVYGCGEVKKLIPPNCKVDENKEFQYLYTLPSFIDFRDSKAIKVYDATTLHARKMVDIACNGWDKTRSVA